MRDSWKDDVKSGRASRVSHVPNCKDMGHPVGLTWRISLGLWLVERLSLGERNEALAGDLAEQCFRDQSMRGFWRQVFAAIGTNWSRAAVGAAPAGAFAVGWSVLFPWWRGAMAGWLPGGIPEQWLTLGWPRPALIELSYGVVPAVSFVWLGALVYVVARRARGGGLRGLRVVSGLSASLNVLLLATVALLHHWGRPDLMYVTAPHFYFGYAVLGVSLPVAGSLLTALLVVEGRRPRVVKGWRVVGRVPQWIERATDGWGRYTLGSWLAARTKTDALRAFPTSAKTGQIWGTRS